MEKIDKSSPETDQAEDRQESKLKAETMWTHFFNDMVDGGDIAKMEGSTVKVYIVIKRHTNLLTGKSFPGIELIREKSGLSRPQVMRCLASLEEYGYISRKKEGRNNIYTLREKVNINDEHGNPQAIATWEYVPNAVKAATTELRNAVLTGKMLGGKIIHIEQLNLHMNVNIGDIDTQVNFNKEIESLPPDIQERLASLKGSLEKRKKP